jgi:SAM-dependent methyltransferase
VAKELAIGSESPAGPLQAGLNGFRGNLPPRYTEEAWDLPFRAAVSASLHPGISILDVGGGATPSLPPAERPAGCEYVGLDLSSAELARAPSGSYDRTVVGDITRHRPELRESFDLVVSWMVLEHVRPTAHALENIRSYLRPRGRMIAQFPGALSPAAIANRVLPHRLARWLLRRTQARRPETVFPAVYDQCTYSRLVALMADRWSSVEIRPLFTGAFYASFSPTLRAAYLAYEEWAYAGGRRDLAAYYLVEAASA